MMRSLLKHTISTWEFIRNWHIQFSKRKNSLRCCKTWRTKDFGNIYLKLVDNLAPNGQAHRKGWYQTRLFVELRWGFDKNISLVSSKFYQVCALLQWKQTIVGVLITNGYRTGTANKLIICSRLKGLSKPQYKALKDSLRRRERVVADAK